MKQEILALIIMIKLHVKVMIVAIGKIMKMRILIVNLMVPQFVYGIVKEFVNLKEKMKIKILLIFVIG